MPNLTSAIHDPAELLINSQHLRVRFRKGVLTATPAGPGLGEREVAIVSAELNRALEQCGRRLRVLLLDLSDVQTMASMGLGLCIDARNTAQANRAKTIIYGLQPRLTELFTMMKIDRLFIMVATPDELEEVLAAPA